MSTIEVFVLKDFPFSRDGYTEENAKASQTIHIPEGLFEGLNNERYVRRSVIGDGKFSLREPSARVVEAKPQQVTAEPQSPAPPEVTAPVSPETGPVVPETAYLRTSEPRVTQEAVEIPSDWKALKWFAMRSLASKVSDVPIKTMDDAVAAIEAELARRG